MARATGATATLLRILVGQKILGSRLLTRGSVPTVSLTENRVDEWHKLRKFQPHLGRWDYEPFGIAMRRLVLERFSARPVIYGDDPIWNSLSPKQQPFFQTAKSGRGRNSMDWTQEREWRILGDIDLRQFGSSDAFVFVGDPASASLLQAFSRWPVVLISSDRE